MLGPLPFVAVWQKHDQAVEQPPFGFTCGDELVNQNLGTIGKVAKLRFPNHQMVWSSASVAIFKTKNRLFREQGIDHQKVGLARNEMLQRNINPIIPTFTFLVMQDRMAMEERAPT